jgi:hypothetical protein
VAVAEAVGCAAVVLAYIPAMTMRITAASVLMAMLIANRATARS